MTKFIVKNRTYALKTDINLFFYDNKFSNYPLSLADASHDFQIHVSVRILTVKFNQWARVNFCCYRKKPIASYFRHSKENHPVWTYRFVRFIFASFLSILTKLQYFWQESSGKLKDNLEFWRYLRYILMANTNDHNLGYKTRECANATEDRK